MHGGSWLAISAVVGLFLLLNLVCWSPGVGSSTGENASGRPKGTELERLFGWPALYRAELWRSEDLDLSSRILSTAPFYWPSGEMTLHTRRYSLSAALINTLVSAILATLAVAAIECLAFGGWSQWLTWPCALLVPTLLALFRAADRSFVLL